MQKVFEKIKENIKALDKYHDGIISVYEAIKIVNQVAEEYNKEFNPTEDLLEFGIVGYNQHLKAQYRKGYSDAKKELQNNNGWIPVSENNLPSENEDVLMVIERKDGNVVVLEETFYKYLLDTPGLIIKYWQPKPKLPLEYQPKGEME